jgi:hypothetical protein
MKLSDLEDFSTLENALERIEIRFDRSDLNSDRLETKIDKLDAKIDKMKAANWTPALVVIVASAVQVIAIIANHIWSK